MVLRAKLIKEQARRLKAARIAAGLRTQEIAAAKLKVKPDTYSSHEGGRRGFDEESAYLYAKAYGVSVSHLLAHDIVDDSSLAKYDTPESPIVAAAPVYGRSAGGVWLEGDLTMDQGEIERWVPASAKADPVHQYARLVVGNSVSNRIPDGFFAIMLKREHHPGPIPYGSLVDVHRERGGLHEYSIKAFYGNRLATDSKELAHQSYLSLDAPEDDTTVVIEGVVIGVYRDI